MIRIIITFLLAITAYSNTASQSAQSHASKGWKLLEKKEFDEAKKEFQYSLAKDTLPGNLAGMSSALHALNQLSAAKAHLLLLLKKYPTHRFTKSQIDLWNRKFPDNPIDQARATD